MFKNIFFLFLILMFAHYLYRRYKFLTLFKKTRQVFEGIIEEDIIKDGDSSAMFLENRLKNYRKYSKNLEMRRYNEICDIIINRRIDMPLQIIDVGCSDAFLFKVLCDKVDITKHRLYGIDISRERILLAQKRFKGINNIEFQCGNAENMEMYNSNEFDIITSIECLEHLIYPQKAVDEMKRILNPEGLLIFSVPSKHMAYFSRINPLTLLESIISLYFPSILPPFHDLYDPGKRKYDTVIHRSFTIQEIKEIMKHWVDLRIRPSDFAFEEFFPPKISKMINNLFLTIKPLNGLGRRFIITAKKNVTQ